MNDPGLEEPIQQAANEVDHGLERNGQKSTRNRRRKSNEAEEKDCEVESQRERSDFERPTRWWLASTLFPLIAGTLGPLANLFSVCALVQTWRIGENGERVTDPTWLIATNAVSLVFALGANLLLLFTFARRIRYLLALPIVITLWYLSAVTLIILLILIRHRALSITAHRVSQSYFYGLLSAILYLIISSLLTLNYTFAHLRKYPPSFNILTIPQRTLMLQTTSFTLYLALGAGIFSRVEHWDFVDGVYWADYTLLTIGLGTDFPLKTATAQGLLIPWAVGGIIIVGLVIGSVRGLVLERAKRKVGRRAAKRAVVKWREERGQPNGDSSRLKEEFDAMRRIRESAVVTRRYTSLGVSALVFVVVWLCGALVFWFTEASYFSLPLLSARLPLKQDSQDWSYGTTLYFTYISLLTIGYGDLYPQSNAGKPFFVLWSLLAVPAVTILISNMGNTVVDWVRNGTVWVGRWTVLPERQGGKESKTIKRLGGDMEKLGGAIEKSEGKESGLAARIAREIRLISVDVGKKPPRKYEWEDWERWIRLLQLDGNSNEGELLLDEDGPLFSEVNETEWVLGRLCKRLEQVLEAELGGKQQN
ncbi:hypothetical protein V5O48_010133 [Marasmius crinis-equi]|uniref:Potassium channel domain-containing protein n=1 Tax=Marasmius crinis-equi TaxID=585013 RepID=A0ABR3F9P9_9AGAR